MMGGEIYEFILLSNPWLFVVLYYNGYIPGVKKDEKTQSPWDYEALVATIFCCSMYLPFLLWDI